MAKKILIVEDEAPLRNALTEKLSSEGFTIELAGDGKEGLKRLDVTVPDLILLDVRMPVMGGLEMLERIREMESLREVPVFVLTNSDQMDTIAEAMDSGVTTYLIKSNWKLQAIVNKVKAELAD